MSHLVEADKVENLEFKWGKKRGVGGKKKEVQFYESFSYDGVDYSLYDCVYMYKEGEPEPYIGKLIKIWENPDRTKKVKVQWFFRPLEILNWLRDKEALENEIFLASGVGAGVANVNSLEAISGKCNVVCISKDSRNPQPSEKELQMAEYIFFRTFDVRHCTISDKMDDKVAGLEVNFVFNRKASEKIDDLPKLDSVKKEEAVACNQTLQLSAVNPSEEFKAASADKNLSHLVAKGSADVKDSLVKSKSLPRGETASGAAVDSTEVAATSGQQGTVSGDKTTTCRVDSGKDEVKVSKVPVNSVAVEDKVKFAEESGASENRLSKKSMVDDSVKLSENRTMNSTQKSTVHGNDAKAFVITTFERKKKTGPGEDSLGSDKGVKSAKDAGALEDRPSKKARFDSSGKLPENKNNNSVQKLSINSLGNHAKDLAATPTSCEEKMKSKTASLGPDKDPKQKTGEKMTKLSSGKMLKAPAGYSPSEDRKTEGDGFEVTRRPDDERSRWFRALPWEERMKNAHEQGTLVLLSNLDPEYTSGEVEDVIWHAFKENCAAKMVQRIAISSPHSGQAFIILKTRGAAERIIKELRVGCLMLSNGRPLVGSVAPSLSFPGKQSTFVGHLFVDKTKLPAHREMKEAVSTSHCSQPNTVEYEMAMEWCLLQSRSDSWWKQLYKQQGEELRKLKTSLKLK